MALKFRVPGRTVELGWFSPVKSVSSGDWKPDTDTMQEFWQGCLAVTSRRKSYPSDLTDEQWQRLAPLLPTPPGGGRSPGTNLRDVVNAVRYLNRTGCGCGWRLCRKAGELDARELPLDPGDCETLGQSGGFPTPPTTLGG